MNDREIDKAKKLLAGLAYRTEIAGAVISGGLCLAAHLIDGGQRIFYTLAEVKDHCATH